MVALWIVVILAIVIGCIVAYDLYGCVDDMASDIQYLTDCNDCACTEQDEFLSSSDDPWFRPAKEQPAIQPPWIKWKGGEYDADPVGGQEVLTICRGGLYSVGKSTHFYWSHDDLDADIVAYLPLEGEGWKLNKQGDNTEPPDDTINMAVDVVYRCGTTDHFTSDIFVGDWDITSNDYDIIAYRPIKQEVANAQ